MQAVAVKHMPAVKIAKAYTADLVLLPCPGQTVSERPSTVEDYLVPFFSFPGPGELIG